MGGVSKISRVPSMRAWVSWPVLSGQKNGPSKGPFSDHIICDSDAKLVASREHEGVRRSPQTRPISSFFNFVFFFERFLMTGDKSIFRIFKIFRSLQPKEFGFRLVNLMTLAPFHPLFVRIQLKFWVLVIQNRLMQCALVHAIFSNYDKCMNILQKFFKALWPTSK